MNSNICWLPESKMALTAMKSEVGRGYFGTRDTAPNVSLYKKHIGLPAPQNACTPRVYRQVVQEPPSARRRNLQSPIVLSMIHLSLFRAVVGPFGV